jgi:hypothetical protein
VTVGALDHVRYPGQFGEYMLTESFTARDPNRTLLASPLQSKSGSSPPILDGTRPSGYGLHRDGVGLDQGNDTF